MILFKLRQDQANLVFLYEVFIARSINFYLLDISGF